MKLADILQRERSIALDKYFELVKPEYKVIEIISHKSIRNYNSSNIAKNIAYTYRAINKRIRIEQKKLFFETNFKISYCIDIEKQLIEESGYISIEDSSKISQGIVCFIEGDVTDRGVKRNILANASPDIVVC